MSKKNSREQRKKQAQKAAASAEQERNLTRKNPDYVKPEKKSKKDKEPEELQIKMNFYSAMAMLSTLVSAGAFVIAMIVTANAKVYAVAAKAGPEYDAEGIVERLNEIDFWGNFSTYLKIGMILLVLTTLFSLLGTIAAMNPSRKPKMSFAVLMVVFSILNLVLYLMADHQTVNMRESFYKNAEFVKTFGVYTLYLFMSIGNIVIQVLNVLGVQYGVNKYKQTGHTC